MLRSRVWLIAASVLILTGAPAAANAVEAPSVPPAVVDSESVIPTLFSGSTLNGTVPGGADGDVVQVYYDGRTDAAGPSATATASGPTLAWSAAQTLTPGSHTFRLVVTDGTTSSSPVTGSMTVVAAPTVDRLTGADRYQAAVAFSQAAFPTGGAPVVYIASGATFPDALAAAPVAVKRGGPLLLTTPDALPAPVQTEVERLHPASIVVVGGEVSVTPAVFDQLSDLATTVTRIGGADRYEVSRNLVRSAFTQSSMVYLATGTKFPDALAASAVAGGVGSPVLLVNGADSYLDEDSVDLLWNLHPNRIKVAGGPDSVTVRLEDSLQGIAPTTRNMGMDRFDAAATINYDDITSSPTIYVATGMTFPDALAGAALAGKGHAALFLARPGCIPQAVVRTAGIMGATSMVLLGGADSLDENVAALRVCHG
ncbi:cell wall-binding repeat-containing protein [Leifsonia sp. RAF41]|uniref:cell wall-binding repeat-containing protein n=1 Tax=Leifsonia sp. RAF41 TaxID=3233056 RepID=UPI003F997444